MQPNGGSEWGEVTRLLREARNGNRDALDRVIPLIYDDLRAVARRQLRREYQERTLHATSLVHEAYVKLVGGETVDATDRAHFLSLAAHAMRQVLVDHARRRTSSKHGEGWQRTALGDASAATEVDAEELLALDDALERLEPRQRQVVECRFFGGMDEQEIASALGVTDRTVRRDWVKARAWLNRLMYGQSLPPDGGG